MRALKASELHAVRDNRNRWQIDPADLDRWSANRPDADRPVTADTPGQRPVNSDSLELAGLRAENVQLRERLDELRTDRDAWRQLATQPKPSFFERIREAFSKNEGA